MNYTYRIKLRLLCPMATFTANHFSLLRRVLLLEKYSNHRAAPMKKQDPAWLASVFSKSTEKTARGSALFAGLCGLLLAIPVFIYYRTIYENAYNFPYEDDFNSALSFISDYAFGGLGFWGNLKLIFSQYNEHRIVFDRLAFLTDYALFGELNFQHLILVGNLSLVLIGILFMKVSFPRLPLPQKLFYLLPVAYSLFLFQYWELSTWSMAALQNLYVVAFALFSLYWLNQSGQRAFTLACIAATLAMFTSGNGMFSFLAGIPLLLLTQSYRKLMIWLGLGGVMVVLYFWGYIRPPYHPDIVDSLFNHTGRAITYFFTLTGMLVGAGRPRLCIAFGGLSLLLTLGLLSYLWYHKRLTDHLVLVGWLIFLYLTCLSLMATRSGMGIGQASTPRYGIVVVMLFATQSVLAIETMRHRYLQLGVVLGSLCIAIVVYLSATNQDNRRRLNDRTRNLAYNSVIYNANPANVSFHWGDSRIAKTIFEDALRKKIYQVPDLTFSDLKSLPHSFDGAQLQTTTSVTSSVQPYETADFIMIYRAWALLDNTLPRNVTIQVIAKSATSCYAFDTQQHAWDDTQDHTLSRQYTHPGFSCVLDKKDLKPGQYKLWLHLTDGKTKWDQPLTIGLDI